MTPEQVAALRALAADYAPDDGGAFGEAVLRRQAARLARSGRDCDRCGQTKPVGAFSRDARERDGLRRYCRECAALSRLRRSA